MNLNPIKQLQKRHFVVLKICEFRSLQMIEMKVNKITGKKWQIYKIHQTA